MFGFGLFACYFWFVLSFNECVLGWEGDSLWLKGFQMTWKLLTRLDKAPNRKLGRWQGGNNIIFCRLLWALRCFPLPLFPYLLPLSRQDSTNDNHHLSMTWAKLETDYTIVQSLKPLFHIYYNLPPPSEHEKIRFILHIYCLLDSKFSPSELSRIWITFPLLGIFDQFLPFWCFGLFLANTGFFDCCCNS